VNVGLGVASRIDAALQERRARLAEHERRIQSHRFCTECWADFLRHERQCQAKVSTECKPRLISCPICRAGIGVPDVWRQKFGLSEAQPESCTYETEQSQALALLRCNIRFSLGLAIGRTLPSLVPGRLCSLASIAYASGSCMDLRVVASTLPQWPVACWAFSRAGPGAAWAAGQSAGPGPPVVENEFAPDVEGWVVSDFGRRVAVCIRSSRVAVELLCALAMYAVALLITSMAADAIVGNERQPGISPHVAAAWRFLASVVEAWTPDAGDVDGYCD